MHDSLNTTPGRPLDNTTAHTRRHTRHTAAHTSCANESTAPHGERCNLGSGSRTARRRASSSSSPARHRSAGGSQAAICERRRVMRKGSRGSGERCITHRQCSGELSYITHQLRVARLRQPEQSATHGPQAARELRPDCSTGRARRRASSRRACRAAFTCRLPTAKPRPGIAPGRYSAPHRRAFCENQC